MILMTDEENQELRFKIWIENGIVMIEMWETKWEESGAKKFIEELTKVLETIEGKANMFCDASKAGFGPTPKALLIYSDLFKSNKIGKSAIFGLNTANRALVSFLLGASGKKDLKVFSNKEKAIKWLKEKT
jgi:hypothetical protein